MSPLGLTLVIICGGIFLLLAIIGTAYELTGELDVVSFLFAAVMWVIGLGLLGGLLYGIDLLLRSGAS